MNKKRLNGFKLTELISVAIISSKDKIMEVEEIYEYILQKVPKLTLEKSSTNWKVILLTSYIHIHYLNLKNKK